MPLNAGALGQLGDAEPNPGTEGSGSVLDITGLCKTLRSLGFSLRQSR